MYDITAEMPEVAASLWHRLIGGLHQRLVTVSVVPSVDETVPR